jgi:N-acetylmuramoyl-L-alanine amidase
MKFKKLIVGILLSIFVFNLSTIKVYAAEGTEESQINNTEVSLVDIQENESNIENESGIVNDTDTEEESIDETIDFEAIDKEIIEKEIIEKQAAENEADIDTEISIEKESAAVEKNDTAQEAKADQKAQKVQKEQKESDAKYTKADLRLLSALVYCEAQAESYNGKLAVAIVVMNRVRSNQFPNTVKDVIYQRHQFSPATNGTLKKALAAYDNGKFTSASEKECIKAAKAALSGVKSITVKGETKDFSKYLYFSGRLKGHTFALQHHQFK